MRNQMFNRLGIFSMMAMMAGMDNDFEYHPSSSKSISYTKSKLSCKQLKKRKRSKISKQSRKRNRRR